MNSENERAVRVLYSFPHKIGSSGVCYAAWKLVKALHDAGAEVTVFAGYVHKPLPEGVRVLPTLSRGKLRLPYKLLGWMGICKLHDRIVARRLKRMADQFDVVQCFALGSLETIRTAKRLGIPTFLERCNAHTGFAYEVVEQECRKLGLTMPDGHAHAYNEVYLRREEAEYEATDYLFCPSEFVARTFEERGYSRSKLARFQYGYDVGAYLPAEKPATEKPGLTVLFAGGCAPRKGLHYALEAWVKSSASKQGKFLIAGDFIPGYAELLQPYLSHPGVSALGYRNDMPDLMRECDVLVLPSIEEGSALVTYDARGSGCVLLVSDSTGAMCEHEVNALVHKTGDVETLCAHFSRVHEDRELLARLRAASLETAGDLTWEASGRRMMAAYQEAFAQRRPQSTRAASGQTAMQPLSQSR